MSQISVIVIVMAGVMLWAGRLFMPGHWSQPGKPPARKKGRRQQDYTPHPYHAVSCEGQCEALETFRDKRFLVRNAPPLPVPSCQAQHCNCRYVHFDDRRMARGDRRGLHGLRSALFSQTDGTERREQRGRRATDFAFG